MASSVLLAIAALAALYILNKLRSWRFHYLEAKKSGLPVIVVPIYMFNLLWMITNRAIMSAVRTIPWEWRPRWVDRSPPNQTWDLQYAAFKDFEDDTYVTASPGGNILFTANPDIITQITARRNDFPKPTWMYAGLETYGPNVISAEGHNWRRQRKITSPPFAEKNNQLVWSESIRETKLALRKWMGSEKSESGTVVTIDDDVMRLTLHVISSAGFGVPLIWPGLKYEAGDKPTAFASQPGKGESLANGHTLTHKEALESLTHDLPLAVALGPKLLKWLPFKRIKKLYQGYVEWGQYMQELLVDKRAQIAAGSEESGLDLMGALIKGTEREKDGLSDPEILGNAFIFILAGHETTANALHFSLVYLALAVSSQRRLQADLDAIFGDRPAEQWDYERDLPRLFGGMAGAVLAETLRLVPPVIEIPKKVHAPQTLTLNSADGSSRKILVPAGTTISLSSTAVHRNAKYWPHGPPADPARPVHPLSNTDNDLEEYRPERWLLSGSGKGRPAPVPEGATTLAGAAHGAGQKLDEGRGLDVDQAADTAASLYRPPQGAYIPFSYGYRSCLGRRFGQVEVLAVLAAIFRDYSVELAVDQWASDEEVARMGEAERRAVWEKARDEVLRMMRVNMLMTITLQLRDGKKVPVRFVKRGKERFDWR